MSVKNEYILSYSCMIDLSLERTQTVRQVAYDPDENKGQSVHNGVRLGLYQVSDE